MILRYFSVIDDAPMAFVTVVGAFVFTILVSLSFHEFSHAYAADRLGDRTPRSLGRVTLNPRAHLDPIGSLMILIIGFGWAKPVPINPYNTRNPQRSLAMIASAGPLSNLMMAGLAGIPIKTGMVPGLHPFVLPSAVDNLASFATDSTGNMVGLFLGTIVLINILLAIFNLIPLAPLDGFNVAVGLLPRELSQPLERAAPWMPGILMILILMPFLTNSSPLFELMAPIVDFFLELFVGDSLPIRFG
ncbi:MAG TPA: site-2 protease family protein [Dehalococcoidia bacterium]|nr:site-2 protease family protein [Dehalococcoidia bacterium]